MKRLITLLITAAAVASCSTDAGPSTPSEPQEGLLRVLAGSELVDLEPLLARAAEATGVEVEFTFTGTLEGAQTLAAGTTDFDAVWFSSNRYVQAIPEASARLAVQTKVMASPVVLGLAESKARELGWVDAPVTWADIAEAASAKRFTYGMTDPSASNSGFSALVAVASALSGSGDAIDAAAIDAVTPALTGFFAAQALSAGSSGWLSDAYQRRAAGTDPGPKIDGLVNYESVLLSMNQSGALPEPLVIIRPSDGVVTADYPLTLLTGTAAAARADFDRLTAHLLSPEAQAEIVATTQRRPVTPGVALPESFGTATLIELPFPATAAAFDALLSAYFDRIRRPSRTVYVLDTSGSMKGDRIAGLHSALGSLTGADGDEVGKYRKFRSREEVTLLPFTDVPGSPKSFTVDPKAPDTTLGAIRDYTGTLVAEGGTAIYDSLATAYDLLGAESTEDRFVSIVLMTDGDNTNGSDIAAFTRRHAALPPSAKAVPVFTVVFGESDQSEMEQLATLTGGRLFDARDSDLTRVFREIRGYQ
ncbi:substrate-binding domain-containing protein [Actinokineospora sp. 24-640]